MSNRTLVSLALALFLIDCGGGGGGGGGGGSTPAPPPAQAAVSFTPSTLTLTGFPNVSYPDSVQATVNNPSAFAGVTTLYVFVVDPNHVLNGSVSLSPIDSLHYTALVQLANNLAVGNYQGTFEIQFCKDPTCATQVTGSPFALPYDFTITNCPPGDGLSVAGNTSATAVQGGSSPPDITVTAYPACLAWTATSDSAWLQVNNGAGAAGSGMVNFSVSFLPGGLAVGTYTGNVTLHTSDGMSAVMQFGFTITP